MNRQEYAQHNAQRYLDWCDEIDRSPYDAVEKLEWAIISAHCKFQRSVDGFRATRGVTELVPMAEALNREGVNHPGNKAAFIMDLRDRCLYGDTPLPESCYQQYRRDYKLPGLGHCKLSFGACLIDPFGSNIVCLDTHMLQVYLGYRPDGLEINRHYKNLKRYAAMESVLMAEADSVGLPPFAYQWAVWDWKRVTFDGEEPNDHSFLWRN